MGTIINFSIFNVKSFKEFLIIHLNKFLEIEIRKIQNQNAVEYVVYPKNYRLQQTFSNGFSYKTEKKFQRQNNQNGEANENLTVNYFETDKINQN